MFRAIRQPLLTQATRSAARTHPVCRALSTTPRRLSAEPPSIFGPGSPAGVVPTDEAQATGLDRLQMLGRMEKVDVFNREGLRLTKMGTLADPIMIPSLAPERIVGCTGFPVDSHDIIWLNLRPDRKGRCPECGNVFALDYEEGEHDAHHH